MSTASNPGFFTLSDARLAALQPELVPGISLRRLAWQAAGLVAPGFDLGEVRERLAVALRDGDCRAAVVVSDRPLRVAAYSDEFDAVVLLAFPDRLADEHGLTVGSRLVAVLNYERTTHRDITPGPASTGTFGGVWPLVAEFLTDDAAKLDAVRRRIPEEEWQRAESLGQEKLRIGGPVRDGRPRYSRFHAGGVREAVVTFAVVAAVVTAAIWLLL